MTDRTEQLQKLRPLLTDVIGFYELLYEADIKASPLDRMAREVWFNTAAHALAVQVLKIIEETDDD